jgi:hypothetical protein
VAAAGVAMSISINANSPGERLVVALAILTLCVELLADNGHCARTETMSDERCVQLCQPEAVRRIDAFSCECEAGQGTQ